MKLVNRCSLPATAEIGIIVPECLCHVALLQGCVVKNSLFELSTSFYVLCSAVSHVRVVCILGLWPEKHQKKSLWCPECADGHEHHIEREERNQVGGTTYKLCTGMPTVRGRNDCVVCWFEFKAGQTWTVKVSLTKNICYLQEEKKERQERIRQKTAELQELILQVS